MLEYHARSKTRAKEKRRNKIAHILVESVEEVIGMYNSAKEELTIRK